MKVAVPKQSLKKLLRWSQLGLFACAAALLGYCIFVLVDTLAFQERESRILERLLEDRHAAGGDALPVQPLSPPTIPPASAMSGLIGRIEIARLGLSVMIMEGDDGKTLRRAAGHVPGTALPGQLGNVGITAHRDTFFRPLRNIRMDDVITLTTLQGEYQYRVVSTRIVSPQDVEVLDSSGGEVLTLVTCHPFYFVGAAPNRFIVRAERVKG
ncbi:MAG TPA: class D sortase [Bryobacteraceae bacterium]|nr:class D sortase [Bryobacteraceae bacterium]